MSNSPDVIVLSDDLTGTTGAGADAIRHSSSVAIVPWTKIDTFEPEPVSIVDTHSRLLDGAEAAARVREVMGVLMDRFGLRPHFHKRVDTQLRGPVAEELAAWAHAHRQPVLFAMSAPSLGVTTVGGHQLLHGEALRVRADDPDASRVAGPAELLSPAPTVLAADASREAVRDALRVSRFVSMDGSASADLDYAGAIAWQLESGGEPVATVGSIGLLASYLRSRRVERRQPGVLVVSDSLKPATRGQLSAFAAHHPLFALGELSDDALVDVIRDRLAEGSDVALSSIVPDEACAIADSAVAMRVADIAARVLEQIRPRGLVVMGGEAASQLVRRLDIDRLDVVSEPWPATPISRLRTAGPLEGLDVVFQSGSQGEPGRLSLIVSTLHGMSITRTKERTPS